MRSEEEIRGIIKRINEAVDTDNDEEYDRVCNDKDFAYICNVEDTLFWVLGEIETERFLSDAYMNLENLRRKAKGMK